MLGIWQSRLKRMPLGPVFSWLAQSVYEWEICSVLQFGKKSAVLFI